MIVKGKVRILAAIILLSQSILFYNYFIFQSNLTKVLNGSRDSQVIIDLFSGLPYERPLVEATTKIYNSGERNCVVLNYLTNHLIKSNPRSAPAFYIKGVCSEISGDLISAKQYIEKSISFDKFNPDYLYGLAIVQYKLGNFNESKILLAKYKSISNDLSRISKLEQLLNLSK